jgi:hypothetical protein
MGFGLIIRFIDHLQIVTASNYNDIANAHILQFTTALTKFSQSAVVHQSLSGNGYQQRMFPYSGFLNYPRASATSS